MLACTRECDVKEPPFFLRVTRFVVACRGEESLLETDHENRVKLESFCRVHCHERYSALIALQVELVLLALKCRLLQETLNSRRWLVALVFRREICELAHVAETFGILFRLSRIHFLYTARLDTETDCLRCRQCINGMPDGRYRRLECRDFCACGTERLPQRHLFECDFADTARRYSDYAREVALAFRILRRAQVGEHVFHFFAFEESGTEDPVRQPRMEESFFEHARLGIFPVQDRNLLRRHASFDE